MEQILNDSDFLGLTDYVINNGFEKIFEYIQTNKKYDDKLILYLFKNIPESYPYFDFFMKELIKKHYSLAFLDIKNILEIFDVVSNILENTEVDAQYYIIGYEDYYLFSDTVDVLINYEEYILQNTEIVKKLIKINNYEINVLTDILRISLDFTLVFEILSMIKKTQEDASILWTHYFIDTSYSFNFLKLLIQHDIVPKQFDHVIDFFNKTYEELLIILDYHKHIFDSMTCNLERNIRVVRTDNMYKKLELLMTLSIFENIKLNQEFMYILLLIGFNLHDENDEKFHDIISSNKLITSDVLNILDKIMMHSIFGKSVYVRLQKYGISCEKHFIKFILLCNDDVFDCIINYNLLEFLEFMDTDSDDYKFMKCCMEKNSEELITMSQYFLNDTINSRDKFDFISKFFDENITRNIAKNVFINKINPWSGIYEYLSCEDFLEIYLEKSKTMSKDYIDEWKSTIENLFSHQCENNSCVFFNGVVDIINNSESPENHYTGILYLKENENVKQNIHLKYYILDLETDYEKYFGCDCEECDNMTAEHLQYLIKNNYHFPQYIINFIKERNFPKCLQACNKF